MENRVWKIEGHYPFEGHYLFEGHSKKSLNLSKIFRGCN